MTVYFRPYRALADAPLPRTPEDHALLAYLTAKTGVTITPSAAVDFEDWMEPATLLAAALRRGVAIRILDRGPLDTVLHTGGITIPGTPCPDVLLGRLTKEDTRALPRHAFAWPRPNENRANQYAELATFAKAAGRQIALAHFPGEHGQDLPRLGTGGLRGVDIDTAIAQFSGPIAIKQLWPGKAFPLTFAEATGQRGNDLLFSLMDYHVIHYEGNQNALLVQERVPMTHETRFFVINHRVVCGAACIEAHTPQNHHSNSRLDPVFEPIRNSGTCVTDTAVRDRMLQEADLLACAIHVDAPELTAYTLDLALGADGTILIVELNPASQAGLYAQHVDLLLSAILEE